MNFVKLMVHNKKMYTLSRKYNKTYNIQYTRIQNNWTHGDLYKQAMRMCTSTE